MNKNELTLAIGKLQETVEALVRIAKADKTDAQTIRGAYDNIESAMTRIDSMLDETLKKEGK